MKTKLVLTTAILSFIGFTFLPVLPAYAATTAITGGTYGPSCNSGGYFTPSSVTITSGDTVTFSVPSNDPYSGGLEIHGFPQGNFTVATGGSFTTNALTADVSYYGTWPSTGCTKGSGTITVSAPAPPVTPASGGSSSGSSGSTGTTSSKTTAKAATTTTPTTTTTTAATGTTTNSTTTQQTTAAAKKTKPESNATTKKPAYKMLATIGGGTALLFIAALFMTITLMKRGKMHAGNSAKTSTPTTTRPTESADMATTDTKMEKKNEVH